MENESSQEWVALHTFLITCVVFFAFVGVVGVALQLEHWRPHPTPVAQAQLPPPTLAPTAIPLASPTPYPLPTAMFEPTVESVLTRPQTPLTHLVQSGETLSLIATQYDLTLENLLAANELSNPDVVWVGQVLLIPQGNEGIGVAAAPPPLTFTQSITPTTVNGIPFDQVLLMPDEVLQNVQAIYERGQAMGRNPHAFSKVGDSTIDGEHFLSRFETGPYQLGSYAFLQPTIDYFAGSLGRQGYAVRVGLHSWTALDPLWADKSVCEPAETVVACELRLHNPSLVFIRLGSNDAGVPENFAANVREIVSYAIAQGVIPVLGTKADRFEGSDENNAIIRQIAAEMAVPLWDFDAVAATLPGRGLDEDGIHLNTFYAFDFSQPTAFERGHAMHNLTALLVLDTIRVEIMKDEG